MVGWLGLICLVKFFNFRDYENYSNGDKWGEK